METRDAITDWIRQAAATRFPAMAITADSALIENGFLDSLEILNLVGFLEERFGIALPVDEFVPENFRSADAIANLVTRLRAAQPAG